MSPPVTFLNTEASNCNSSRQEETDEEGKSVVFTGGEVESLASVTVFSIIYHFQHIGSATHHPYDFYIPIR